MSKHKKEPEVPESPMIPDLQFTSHSTHGSRDHIYLVSVNSSGVSISRLDGKTEKASWAEVHYLLMSRGD